MTDRNTGIVATMLSSGERIFVEAIPLDGFGTEVEVILSASSFKSFTDGVEAVVQQMIRSLGKVRLHSANIVLNFEIGVESGQLMALLVKGGGTASVRITLDFSTGDYL